MFEFATARNWALSWTSPLAYTHEKVLEQFYEAAAADQHPFLYVNLLADRREDMFYKNLGYRLRP